MIRDGKTMSVWQEVVPFINMHEERAAKDVFDVIIIGAGITGLSTALRLQEAGKKCLVLEGHNIGFGTTSATTAHINTVLDTSFVSIIKGFGLENARIVASAARNAVDHIAHTVDRYRIACDFEYLDGFLFAENEEEDKELDELYEALQEVSIETSYTDQVPVPVPFTRAIRFGKQAQFHPVKYLLALAEAFLEAGGAIREKAMVAEVGEQEGMQVVTVDDTQYRAHAVVYATHIPPGLNMLDFKVAPYRTYVLGAELEDDAAYPAGLVYDSKDPYHYFRTAYLDDRKILIVGGEDHKTGHKENTDQSFLALEAYVRNHYKVRAVPYKWSSQYYESADGLPYIGRFQGASSAVYVATGFGGNGMTYGTLSALIIADLILKGDNPYAALFSPGRIRLLAAFKNLVKENADVIGHLVADRFSIESLREFADLSKEEGRVVKYMEHNIAIYKDEYGKLQALNPVCPHAGCIVKWNSAEKSWDCPCHGARYDVNGEVLNGPATIALRRIELK